MVFIQRTTTDVKENQKEILDLFFIDLYIS